MAIASIDRIKGKMKEDEVWTPHARNDYAMLSTFENSGSFVLHHGR